MKSNGNGESAKAAATNAEQEIKSKNMSPGAPEKEDADERPSSTSEYRHDEYDDYNPW